MADEELGEIGDADKIKLNDIFNKEIYDFGDNWEHKISLEKITDEKIKHPIVWPERANAHPKIVAAFGDLQNSKKQSTIRNIRNLKNTANDWVWTREIIGIF